jgi:hypothetical protein
MKNFPIFFVPPSREILLKLLSPGSYNYLESSGKFHCEKLTKAIYLRNSHEEAADSEACSQHFKKKSQEQFPMKWENSWPSSIIQSRADFINSYIHLRISRKLVFTTFFLIR